jgi:hypothetical protein
MVSKTKQSEGLRIVINSGMESSFFVHVLGMGNKKVRQLSLTTRRNERGGGVDESLG